MNATKFFNKPCAVKGLTSYRYMGMFGWIMIGAKNNADALNEANRSLSRRNASLENLQVWSKRARRYIPVNSHVSKSPGDQQRRANQRCHGRLTIACNTPNR